MATPNILEINKMNFPWETQDPFLFCAHHADDYPEGNSELGPEKGLLAGRRLGEDFIIKDGWRMYHGQTIPGFPYHPHRGFETITIAKEGVVDHADSLGASGRFSNGDAQWMTAGKGVQHSEMFPLINSDKGNRLEIFQIWLNLPKKHKLVEPHYKMLWSEDVPIISEMDEKRKETNITLIAGNYKGTAAPQPTPNSWANDPENEVRVWTIKMEANSKWTLPKAGSQVNSTLFFYDGDSLNIENQEVKNYHSIEVNSLEDIQITAGPTDCFLLLLQGRPINEPVAKYGPFVMNTQQEIQQAFADYQRTQFGGWPWDRSDVVHERKMPRFAKYADGVTEEKK